MSIPTFIDGQFYIDDQPVTEAEAVAAATADPGYQQYSAAVQAFDLLYAATEAIREWAMDTQAWIYTAGAAGAFDEAGFLTLVQQAEAAGLAYNALPPEALTPALIQEQAGMALRGQQAQILYGMAKAP